MNNIIRVWFIYSISIEDYLNNSYEIVYKIDPTNKLILNFK